MPKHIFAVHRIIQRAKVDVGFVPIRFFTIHPIFRNAKVDGYLCQTALQPDVPTEVPMKSSFRNEKDMKKGFHPEG